MGNHIIDGHVLLCSFDFVGGLSPNMFELHMNRHEKESLSLMVLELHDMEQ